ncbi:Enoyl-CoA delta isomerase 1, peroxisomal [Zancudomyces culisetae]|uniref:Enoyl-CoA delta isomerase 1, peroxisomal n=1 Tax=Zancudomyces culisetae TaxID=1213189 RepID=A0A1R1PCH9_ZANCU|nr:Enoyl-CoA delta isomerase 1, peroxisomal [Zancudomyces culisetae]|eukprot:OMH78685.1 Enoyl-CoA delta isomerase 1, peroxisomal [Zancudomyces culisetae]
MTSIYLPNEKEKLVKLYVPDKNKPTHFVMELVSLPENRFDMELIGAINNALDIVDTAILSLPDDKKNIGGSLITTSSGKFFSNGFNLQKAWKNVEEFYPAVQKLYARFLTFRVPTIAAINGHAFAGGCVGYR